MTLGIKNLCVIGDQHYELAFLHIFDSFQSREARFQKTIFDLKPPTLTSMLTFFPFHIQFTMAKSLFFEIHIISTAMVVI